MLSVKHTITVGSGTYTLGNETRLLDLRVQAALAVPVNAARIVLGPPAGLTIAAEDKVSVELGYDDKLEKVFSGTVGATDWQIDRVTVYATGAFQTLAAARLNLVYQKPKGGDIVSDVVSKLKLTKDKVEPGLKFEAYALGENQTAYEHLHALARQCGFDLYANTEDKLVFAKYKAAATHEFKYGLDILALTLDERIAPVSGVEIYGESPASLGQGADAASWLTKKDVKGSAGGKAGLVVRLADPTARTQETAGKIAEAALAAGKPKLSGVLKTLGAPGVKLGDAVKISEMPLKTQNGTFKVTGVTHTLNAKKGFVTTIAIEGAEQ
jgi:phage protein D